MHTMQSAARALGQLGANLGLWIGEREDQRARGHGHDHVGLDHSRSRQPEKDICADQDIGSVRASVCCA